jgi:hypothetical protein
MDDFEYNLAQIFAAFSWVGPRKMKVKVKVTRGQMSNKNIKFCLLALYLPNALKYYA